MYSSVILPVLALAHAATAVAVSREPRGLFGADPTATISIGQIVGVQTSLPNGNAAVNKFLGVPFAEPPVRFARPVPAKPLSKPLNTKQWKPGYPAANRFFISGVYATPPMPESEDCLYLNVYAPATYNTGRAVFVWIPAGEMQFGNAGQPSFDGSAFAAYHDIIVVTPNFRTNGMLKSETARLVFSQLTSNAVFGLPSSPQLNGTDGNLALLDQRLALQWVQDNIATFGGDPKKVTVGGVSSGAWNAEILMYTTVGNPPFRAIIAESGNAAYLPFQVQNGPQGWNNLTATLGCGNTTDKIACMRTKNAQDIERVVETNKLGFFLNLDNATLPSSPYQVIQSGNFVHVPILTGTSAQEGRFYAFGQKNVTALLTLLAKTSPTLGPKIPAIVAAYPVGGQYKSDYEALAAILTDYLFACPAALLTNNWRAQGVPVYQYLYNASFPNIAFAPNAGAYHASEPRIVFQTDNGGPINPIAVPQGLLQTELPSTIRERQLSTYVNSVWAQFINDPASGPGWDTFRASGKPQVAVLGNQPSTFEYADRNALTAHCDLFLDLYSAASPGVGKLSPADYQ